VGSSPNERAPQAKTGYTEVPYEAIVVTDRAAGTVGTHSQYWPETSFLQHRYADGPKGRLFAPMDGPVHLKSP